MTEEGYLLIDLGTGSTRVSLVSDDGVILGIKSFTNIYYEDERYPDARYFIPEEWEKKILECGECLHREHPDVQVMAVSSAGVRQGVVLADATGQAFYGLPSMDNRGREFLDEIPKKDEIHRISGKKVTEDFCAAKLLGLKKKHPDLYEKIDKVVSVSEWMALLFTSKAVMEPSQACEMQLYDLYSGSWSKELCDLYQIQPDILPPLVQAGTAVSEIKKEYRQRMGIAEHAPFLVGGADTQLALKQTGAGIGDMVVVSGSSSPVVLRTKSEFPDSRQGIWIDSDLGGKGFLREANPGLTGLNYRRIKETLCADLSYEELESLFEKKSSFSCTANFTSQNVKREDGQAAGGLFIPSLSDPGFDTADIAWAVLADIACSVYEKMLVLYEGQAERKNDIRGCGGGFQSTALCRMIADISGCELKLLEGYEQATLFGLVDLCNESLGKNAKLLQSRKEVCYRPNDRSLIHSYYPLWKKNQKKNKNWR